MMNPVTAQVSLWGLYQIDQTILDNLHIPEDVDRETLINNLLIESESLEILYPNPVFLKHAIDVWSKERLTVWEKLYNTTILEYNPIENYDRMEEGTNNASGTSGGNNTAIHSNTAYNSNTFADTSKDTNSGTNEYENETAFQSRTHGNIGVTTSQQMIEAEREVVKFCLSGYIINEFMDRFCLSVY